VERREAVPKLMVLGDDLGHYAKEPVLTPCFNEHLSKRAFEGLGYYHSAGKLYQLFQKADPATIIDKIGVMPEVRNRFPKMESGYRKTGKDRYEKISN